MRTYFVRLHNGAPCGGRYTSVESSSPAVALKRALLTVGETKYTQADVSDYSGDVITYEWGR